MQMQQQIRKPANKDPHERAWVAVQLYGARMNLFAMALAGFVHYIWEPGEAGGSTLLGYPITELEDMPDIATDEAAIAFGDFARGYLIVDRAGVRVLRDPYSAKPYVLFYVTKRVGGGVQNFDAIKALKFGAS